MCEATSKAIQAEAEGIVNYDYEAKFYLLTNKQYRNSILNFEKKQLQETKY